MIHIKTFKNLFFSSKLRVTFQPEPVNFEGNFLFSTVEGEAEGSLLLSTVNLFFFQRCVGDTWK